MLERAQHKSKYNAFFCVFFRFFRLRFRMFEDKKRKKNRMRFFTQLERMWQRVVKEISDAIRKGWYL